MSATAHAVLRWSMWNVHALQGFTAEVRPNRKYSDRATCKAPESRSGSASRRRACLMRCDGWILRARSTPARRPPTRRSQRRSAAESRWWSTGFPVSASSRTSSTVVVAHRYRFPEPRRTASRTRPPARPVAADGAQSGKPGRSRPDSWAAAPGCASPSSGCCRRGTCPVSRVPQAHPPGVRRRDGHTEQGQRNPETELSEVIRMPRPRPQSAVHRLIIPAVGLTPDEPMHLHIGDQLEANGCQAEDESDIGQPPMSPPGRVTATYTGSMPANTSSVGMRWIVTRSTTNSHRPARSRNIG